MTVLGASMGLNGMRRLPGGEFAMGSEDFYPEEAPVRRVPVEGFWIDERPVTVGQFRRFIKQTGYVTVAERPLDPALYPDADPALLVPGALVFHPTRSPVDLSDVRNWWSYTPGPTWERPEGPGSDTYTRRRHPVTQVAYEDAAAYAAWAGKALPTEAEWEFAARGGLDGKVFAWGDELAPDGQMLANSWQGEFPWQNLRRRAPGRGAHRNPHATHAHRRTARRRRSTRRSSCWAAARSRRSSSTQSRPKALA